MTPAWLAETLAMCDRVDRADAAATAASDAADIPWSRDLSPALDRASDWADENLTAECRTLAPALAARLRVVMGVMAAAEPLLDDDRWRDLPEHVAGIKAAYRAAVAKLEGMR